MDCDYCQGIGPDHVRLDCGLSYPIRPGTIRTRSAREYPVVSVHITDVIIYITDIVIHIIIIIYGIM